MSNAPFRKKYSIHEMSSSQKTAYEEALSIEKRVGKPSHKFFAQTRLDVISEISPDKWHRLPEDYIQDEVSRRIGKFKPRDATSFSLSGSVKKFPSRNPTFTGIRGLSSIGDSVKKTTFDAIGKIQDVISHRLPASRVNFGTLKNSQILKFMGKSGAMAMGTSLLLPGNYWEHVGSSMAFDLMGTLTKAKFGGGLRNYLLGGLIGSVAARGIGTFAGAFSGKKDAYNIIEGLKHGGQAEITRKTFTDFGSGYQGLKTDRSPEVSDDFDFFKYALKKYGVKSGTGHERILIPKSVLTESEIENELNFDPVSIAIPEAGQVANRSFRHVQNNYHIHEFEDSWSMHEDRHSSMTMALRRSEADRKSSISSKAAIAVSGMKHVFSEGVPGAYYYLKGQIAGVNPMDQRLKEGHPQEYREELQKRFGTNQQFWDTSGYPSRMGIETSRLKPITTVATTSILASAPMLGMGYRKTAIGMFATGTALGALALDAWSTHQAKRTDANYDTTKTSDLLTGVGKGASIGLLGITLASRRQDFDVLMKRHYGKTGAAVVGRIPQVAFFAGKIASIAEAESFEQGAYRTGEALAGIAAWEAARYGYKTLGAKTYLQKAFKNIHRGAPKLIGTGVSIIAAGLATKGYKSLVGEEEQLINQEQAKGIQAGIGKFPAMPNRGSMAAEVRDDLTDFKADFESRVKLLEVAGSAAKKIGGLFKKPKAADIGVDIAQAIQKRGISIVETSEEYYAAMARAEFGDKPEQIKKFVQMQMEIAGPMTEAMAGVEGKVIFKGHKSFSQDILKGSKYKPGTERYGRLEKALEDITLYHEAQEVEYGLLARQIAGAKPSSQMTIEEVRMVTDRLKAMQYGTHNSIGVIRGEIAYARSKGKDHWEALKLLRESEGMSFKVKYSREHHQKAVMEYRHARKEMRMLSKEAPEAELQAVQTRYRMAKRAAYKEKNRLLFHEAQKSHGAKRRQLFRDTSTEAVGIGLRQSNNATKGHTGFHSTGM